MWCPSRSTKPRGDPPCRDHPRAPPSSSFADCSYRIWQRRTLRTRIRRAGRRSPRAWLTPPHASLGTFRAPTPSLPSTRSISCKTRRQTRRSSARRRASKSSSDSISRRCAHSRATHRPSPTSSALPTRARGADFSSTSAQRRRPRLMKRGPRANSLSMPLRRSLSAQSSSGTAFSLMGAGSGRATSRPSSSGQGSWTTRPA
mmetsp:Transcript_884/g.2303  ORF Transcript_884/g.2303 Transcript_884/m.2303 type:complete len:202 (+) Transcript_884:812-1417(+)